MSNKSRGPQRPNSFQEFLTNAAQKAQAQRAEGSDENEGDDEDLNQVPTPTSQTINDDCIEWLWDIDGGYLVTARLYTKVHGSIGIAGDYTVELMFTREVGQGEAVNVRPLSRSEAHNVGHSLLAAYKWHDVWRDYAGDFLWNSLTGEK